MHEGRSYADDGEVPRPLLPSGPKMPHLLSFFELATDRVMGREAQRTRPPSC